MARLCQRPTCSGPATAQVRFDVATLRVLVERLDDDPRAAAVLCDVHAARVTAPLGWSVDDLRVSAPPLFRDERIGSADSGMVTTFNPRRVARRRTPPSRPGPGDNSSATTVTPDAPSLPLLLVAPTTDESATGPRGSGDRSLARAAAPNSVEGVVGLLQVESPLLSRAFAQASNRRLAGGLAALIPTAAAAS